MSHSDVVTVPEGAPFSPAAVPPVPTVIVNNPPNQYFTAEQMEAARQQEKDKLYTRLQSQDEQLNQFKSTIEELTADKKARDDAAAKAEQEAADARKKADEAKLSAEELIRVREAELKQQQDQFQKEMDLKLATMQKEQGFLILQSFIQRRVAEEIAANTIIPDLVEFIGGNTEDEVEASITKVKEKTANIVKGAATLTAPHMPTGVSPTGGPANPLDALGGPRQYTPEEIEAMSMAEYAAFRQKAGIAGAGNNRGLFG